MYQIFEVVNTVDQFYREVMREDLVRQLKNILTDDPGDNLWMRLLSWYWMYSLSDCEVWDPLKIDLSRSVIDGATHFACMEVIKDAGTD